ncbi:MAG: hypothetical protein IT371_22945 [Deltaproteobacteria bacterium]|nr:hypothetical protein [Deltaproteobacteria bacterium]
MRRNYLGLSCSYHKPSWALVDHQGAVRFAEATDRYLQTPWAYGCVPDQLHRITPLIRKYADAGIELVVATSWKKPMAPGWLRPVGDLVARGGGALGRAAAWTGLFYRWQRLSMEAAGRNVEARYLESEGWGGQVSRLRRRAYSHLRCHAAAACYSSPFREAACAVLDGLGEGTFNAYYRYVDGGLDELAAPRLALGSLSLLYDVATHLAGFDPLRGEQALLRDLAAHGTLEPRLYALLSEAIVVRGLGVQLRLPLRRLDAFWDELRAFRPGDGAEPTAGASVAFTALTVAQELILSVLGNLRRETGLSQLVFTGSCAADAVLCGRIVEKTGFSALHVGCAPTDEGNALGAAWLAYRDDHPAGPLGGLLPSGLGSCVSQEALDNLTRHGRPPGLTTLDADEEIRRLADLLADGKLVGWLHGAAELGARPLGHRVILADPRRGELRTRLAEEVKGRPSFRPFACAVLDACGAEYFDPYLPSRYMESALSLRPAAATTLPTLAHPDGRCAVHSVFPDGAPRLWELLQAFRSRTGVGLLLMTSLNASGRPAIASVDQALGLYYTTALDALCIEGHLMVKDPRSGRGMRDA